MKALAILSWISFYAAVWANSFGFGVANRLATNAMISISLAIVFTMLAIGEAGQQRKEK